MTNVIAKREESGMGTGEGMLSISLGTATD